MRKKSSGISTSINQHEAQADMRGQDTMELEEDTSAPNTLVSKCSSLDSLNFHTRASDKNLSEIELANEEQQQEIVHNAAAQAAAAPLLNIPPPQDLLDDSGMEAGGLHAENIGVQNQLQQKRRGIFPKIATNSMRAWLFKHLEVCNRIFVFSYKTYKTSTRLINY